MSLRFSCSYKSQWCIFYIYSFLIFIMIRCKLQYNTILHYSIYRDTIKNFGKQFFLASLARCHLNYVYGRVGRVKEDRFTHLHFTSRFYSKQESRNFAHNLSSLTISSSSSPTIPFTSEWT